MTKPLLSVLSGQRLKTPPIWLMRQAGRYLPEYRKLRSGKNGFLDMVYDPVAAAEVTMQPIRRYAMDGAILFSDILIVPHVLGQDVRFEEGRGPVLSPIRDQRAVNDLDTKDVSQKTSSIGETLDRVASLLKQEGFDQTTLIGFAGAPWTVACYMVEGGSSKDFFHVKQMAWQNPELFSALLDHVIEGTIIYLRMQADAGAEVLKLFDSWAGLLDEAHFDRYAIAPAKKIVFALKESHPHIPIIGFARGAAGFWHRYASACGFDALAFDQHCITKDILKNIPREMPVQGNLDPACLLAGGQVLDEGVQRVLDSFSSRPHIFNLGHGVHKHTPPEHVEQLIHYIRSRDNG